MKARFGFRLTTYLVILAEAVALSGVAHGDTTRGERRAAEKTPYDAAVADTTFVLPPIEVVADRVRKGADSTAIRGFDASADSVLTMLPEVDATKQLTQRRWWIWGAAGAGIAAGVLYFSTARRKPPQGTLRVAVEQTP